LTMVGLGSMETNGRERVTQCGLGDGCVFTDVRRPSKIHVLIFVAEMGRQKTTASASRECTRSAYCRSTRSKL
jgi:hypothetical protein